MTNLVARDQLVSIFERWQRLEEEKAEISEGLKELFAEAKGNGYDPKALRIAFRVEAMTPDELKKDEDLYVLAAVYGTALVEKPRARPAPARVEIIHKIPTLAVADGKRDQRNEGGGHEVAGANAQDFGKGAAGEGEIAVPVDPAAARIDNGPPYDDLEIPAILRRTA